MDLRKSIISPGETWTRNPWIRSPVRCHCATRDCHIRALKYYHTLYISYTYKYLPTKIVFRILIYHITRRAWPKHSPSHSLLDPLIFQYHIYKIFFISRGLNFLQQSFRFLKRLSYALSGSLPCSPGGSTFFGAGSPTSTPFKTGDEKLDKYNGIT